MSEATIEKNKVVTLHFTLRDSDGDVLDESTPDEPLLYLHGADNIVPGLEAKLAGRKAGDSLKVEVPPEEGYGEHDGREPEEVSRSNFPEGVELFEGMDFVAELESGEEIMLWVVGIEGDSVYVTHNHPLAGETLHFEIQVVSIRDAQPEEIEHGHPHGPGGHHHH